LECDGFSSYIAPSPTDSCSVPTVRVRFAPSPTGFLHVGGLRTALYNYLFARKHDGVFVLRIEDTDRARYVDGAVENLIRTLQWAGLDFDEGPGKDASGSPYIQSERLPIYREHVARLLSLSRAYHAFDTHEELEAMRKEQERQGKSPVYDRRALQLSDDEVRRRLDSGMPSVVRMKVPDGVTVGFEDVVRGRVEFSSGMIDDQVLLKSDGYPTYHLANVVDDHLMGITHVIRGEEWLSSTPKHVLLYEYFGWEQPVFAHLPLLLNPDRSKLSKRQGDVAVEDYRSKGYLPEALVNFVAFLGWNPGDEREFFDLEELSQEFSLDRVGKSGAVFNIAKLDSINARYIREMPGDELARTVRPFLESAGIEGVPESYLQQVVILLRERVVRLDEIATTGGYFFRDPETYDESAVKKNWRQETPQLLDALLPALKGMASFEPAALEEAVRAASAQGGVGAGKLIHPLRLAITGVSGGPGLFELMSVLGKETCLRRIERAIARLKIQA
jgi:glutamyl-tRNA synthetase